MEYVSQRTNAALASSDAGSITCAGNRNVSFSEYGRANGIPVLWCHGGPGSRLDPARSKDRAFEAGFRLIGIDRPGYGNSSPQPGRTIDGWVADGLAVADHLGLRQFHVVGVSTGGAYALAFAALHPERVLGVVTCCAMTDMRYAPARELMGRESARAVWDAPDRTRALEVAAAAFGEDGSKMLNVLPLAPSDLALFEDLQFVSVAQASIGSWFAQGVVGYTDDRLADRDGWTSFDVATIRCPVVVLHGDADLILNVIHARHTAELIPGATLRIVEGRGHLSIISEIIPSLTDLSRRARAS